MAKKKAGKESDPDAMWAVRLDFSHRDHERILKISKGKGLSKSAFARMAVLERLEDEERKLAAKP